MERRDEIVRKSEDRREQSISSSTRKLDMLELENMPADTLRYVALKIAPNEIVKLCISKKRFNDVICRDQVFLKNYGRKYLTSEAKLPKYILLELSRLNKILASRSLYDTRYLCIYLAQKDYDQYIIDNSERYGYLRSMWLSMIDACIMYERLEILQYLLGNETPKPYNIGKSAYEYPNLEIIKYLESKNITVYFELIDIVEEAAKSGNLEILKYAESLQDGDYESDQDLLTRGERAIDIAAERLEISLKLPPSGEPANLNVAKQPTEKGYYNIFNYLRKKIPNYYAFIQSAAFGGRLDIVKKYADKNQDLSIVSAFALQSGQLDIIYYLINNHNILDLNRAVYLGYFVIIKYYIEQQEKSPVINRNLLEDAVRGGNMQIFQYLVKNKIGIMDYKNLGLNAISSQQIQFLKYFLDEKNKLRKKISWNLATRSTFITPRILDLLLKNDINLNLRQIFENSSDINMTKYLLNNKLVEKVSVNLFNFRKKKDIQYLLNAGVKYHNTVELNNHMDILLPYNKDTIDYINEQPLGKLLKNRY